MFIKLTSGSMGGTMPSGEGNFVIDAGSVVDYSHDPKEARRLIDRGAAEEVTSLQASQHIAAGGRVQKVPSAASAGKRK
jgi:hypothetical protein